MCRFIGIENITMNALIEVKERNYHKEVTFSKLLRYGKKAASIFEADTGKETALLVSKNYQISMMEKYSDLLDVEAYEQRGVFCLREEVSVDEIEECFRGTIDRNLMNGLMSGEAVRESEAV